MLCEQYLETSFTFLSEENNDYYLFIYFPEEEIRCVFDDILLAYFLIKTYVVGAH